MYKYYYTPVFVPSRGFLFFYAFRIKSSGLRVKFSSPHGDFSFSMNLSLWGVLKSCVFVPSRGFLFFYRNTQSLSRNWKLVFVPSRGFLFFYKAERWNDWLSDCFRPLTGISLFLFRGYNDGRLAESFRPLTGISLFLFRTCSRNTDLNCFRPLTGISLFLLYIWFVLCAWYSSFSSPHGDFSFSIW